MRRCGNCAIQRPLFSNGTESVPKVVKTTTISCWTWFMSPRLDAAWLESIYLGFIIIFVELSTLPQLGHGNFPSSFFGGGFQVVHRRQTRSVASASARGLARQCVALFADRLRRCTCFRCSVHPRPRSTLVTAVPAELAGHGIEIEVLSDHSRRVLDLSRCGRPVGPP